MRRYRGCHVLGLGLNIARSLVNAHGGSLTAHSAGLGQGSQFVVRIPGPMQMDEAHVEMNGSSSASLPLVARPARRRVLVVDDNRDAADMLADLLRELGHTVEVAYDGPSAVSAAARFEPDVALVDIGLPVMDGHQVAGHIRQDPSTTKVRLIALTGYGQEADKRRALDAGFDAHFVKPIDLHRLTSIIAGDAG